MHQDGGLNAVNERRKAMGSTESLAAILPIRDLTSFFKDKLPARRWFKTPR